MDAIRGLRNNKLTALLQNSLHTRMAASSVSILAALLGSMDVAAAPRSWASGSEFKPAAEVLDRLPTAIYGVDGDKTWVQAGEVTDAAGKQITFEVKDDTGKTITGAISEAQFKQLQSLVGDTTTLRIDQKTNRLILNWKDFDIGTKSEVKFVQPSTTSLALNQINNSASPSQILGKLSANGGVYLINPNGIVFGKDSQVNVGSLVASSLNVDDDLFLEKSLGDAIKNDKAAFFLEDNKAATGTVIQVDKEGKLHLASKEENRDKDAPALRGDIAVLDGAKINTTTLNGAVLVAPNVTNAGEIKTPDGQTILAAAQDEAFVLFSSDPSLRGLLIEVNAGGDVNNLGNIIAERGNVTLAGLAVNHTKGVIKATTSVDFNGTVRLLARDTLKNDSTIFSTDQVSALLAPDASPNDLIINSDGKNLYRVAQRGGDVVIGAGAKIEVTPELDSKKAAPDAQKQGVSGVEISANNIELKAGASISAKGGNVFIEATDNLSEAFENNPTANPSGYLYKLPATQPAESKTLPTRITLGEGSKIDVSGVQVDLPMERNVIEVELRGNELADSPLQRGGFLNGKKVLVDVRKGTPLADITAALASVPKQVGERLTQGGSVKIRSAGDVVTKSTSTLDVSGGGIHYAAGYVNTTNLISEGKVINIADASPTRIYSGILGKETATNKRFNITETFTNSFLSSDRGEFVAAFDQGDSAGSLTFTTQAASLQGTVQAGTFSGPDQRLASKSPNGGTFNLNLNLQNINIVPVNVPQVLESNLLTSFAAYKGAGDNAGGFFAKNDVQLTQDLFNNSGFSHYNLVARNGSILFADKTNLHLANGANLSATAANNIAVNGTIQTAGGKVSLATTQHKGDFIPTAIASVDLNRPITMGSNAIINTSGTWVNDNPLLAGNESQPLHQLWIDAGAIKLQAAGDLLLDIESSIIANGGAWVDRLGNFVAGKGGNISLSGKLLSPLTNESISVKAAKVQLPGTLTSYAFNQGGELSITAPSIIISDLPAPFESTYPKEALVFDSRFFQRGGFSGYSVTAQGSSEWVSNFIFDGASKKTPLEINPQQRNYAKALSAGGFGNNGSLSLLPTGTNLAASLIPVMLADYERKPVNLSFILEDLSDYSLHTDARINNFVVPQGVKINADPKANISFTSNTSLNFNGAITAHGGNISLITNGNQQSAFLDIDNFDDVGIWLGKNSLLDASSIWVKNPLSVDGLSPNAIGKVIDAGKVSLSASRGFIFAEQDKQDATQKATIDVSAQAYSTERFVSSKGAGAYVETTMQAAKAGTVSLTAAEGILFDGELKANGAGYGAAGGTLAVELGYSERGLPSTGVGTFERYDFSKFTYNERRIIFEESIYDSLIPKTISETKLGTKEFISDDLNGDARFDLRKLMIAGFDSYLFTPSYTAQVTDAQLANFKNSDLIVNAELIAKAKASTGVGRIEFEGNAALVAGRSIELNTTTLSAVDGRGIVAAPYVKLGLANGVVQVNLNKDWQNSGAITGGKGELFIAATNLNSLDGYSEQSLQALSSSLLRQKNADMLVALNNPDADGLLSLVGNIATQGADNVTLASAGDIRTTGLLDGAGKGDNARYLGSFAVNKNLTLQADQTSPTTLSEFIFSSGQYNFTKFGTYSMKLAEGVITSLNKVNAVEFTLEYKGSDGVVQTTTELATTYEAYDVLEGKLQVGDTVLHPKIGSEDLATKTITAINTPTRTASGNTDGKITILSGGKATPAQSVAGSLIFDAPTIEQNGTLKAPFGQIVFNSQVFNSQGANGSVVIGEGSLTSVSADNSTLLFGKLDEAGALVYNPHPTAPVKPNDPEPEPINGVRLFNQSPEAKVVINSAKVDLQPSATVDLSGGGDLLAYQFVPGPGGSKDVLAATNSGKSFAILPNQGSQYGAYDPNLFNQPGSGKAHTGTGIGETVYLSGTGDLPAGNYTILPARYALLAGAYLITPTGDGQVFSQGQQVRRVDGTPVVAGRFTTANMGEYDSQFSGFVVEKGSIAQTRSEYKIVKATDLFSGVDAAGNHQLSPNDAAKLSVTARSSLNLEANIIAKAANKGLGSELSVSSNNLLITDAPVTGSTAVQVLVDQLTGFESILIGGSRTTNSNGTSTIKATAQQVEVAKDTVLTGPNILLAAKGTDAQHKGLVKLNTGAQVNASGTYNQSASAVTFLGDSLLSVSAGKPLTVTQQSGTLGGAQLAKGSSVQANNGSVLILSNDETVLDGEIKMQGGALNIGAGRVSLGQMDSTVTGLKFTNDALAKLTVNQLQLTSASSIDLFGNVNLNFTDLTLQASSLRGFNAAGTTATGKTTIAVTNSLTLLGNATALPSNASALGAGLGKGELNLTANTLVLGKGNLALGGFEQITLGGTTAIVGESAANIQAFGNKNLTLNSPLFTGTGASNTHLAADGLVKVQSTGTVTDATLKSYSGLGSRWNISGQALDFTGNVVLASGELSLGALGSKAENLTLGAGAKVDVSGRRIAFDDTSVASNGGKINLNSTSGNVVLDASSALNISGVNDVKDSAGNILVKGSDAGKLSVSALAGQANLEGTIAAVSGTKNKGGSLDLAVKSLTDFSKLIQQVTAGNFSEAFGLRVSTGDLAVKSTDQIKAHTISLTADNGSITLAGKLDASGDKGKITVNASKDLNLQSTAQLLAESSIADQGGDVFLGTSGGFINIADGAKIKVAGNGTVTFRAPRTQGGKIITGNQVGDDVAITLLGQENLSKVITGAAKVDVDAFKVYDIISAISEIFNTDVNGNSTLIDATAIVSYRDRIPFGAMCPITSGGCNNLIQSDSNNTQFIAYPSIAASTKELDSPLPVGAVCNDPSGCNYSYKINATLNADGEVETNSHTSIVNVDTKAFMKNAQAIEERLFGTFMLLDDKVTRALDLGDAWHLKPELEVRTQGNLVVDQAIDFGEGLGILNESWTYDFDRELAVLDNSFAYDHDIKPSTWRFNDEEISASVYYPSLFSSEDFTRFTNGEAGVLTLRSKGDISFNAPVSDGFTTALTQNGLTRVELSNEAKGWNYNWVAGADLASANSMATGNAGQLAIADNVVLRTSTGDINIASAGNLLMGENAALYTAGHATDRGVYDALTVFDGFDNFDYSVIANAQYATNGGKINIQVGNNLEAEGTPQYINDWLQRVGGVIGGSAASSFPDSSLPSTWTIVYEDFKQGIATLGGGDIHINAGGTINNLSVSLPTTGKNNSFTKDETTGKVTITETTKESLQIQGGGDLSVVAGGDILSGQFFVARGNADINAAGSVTAATGKSNIALGLMDGHVNITAGGSVDIANIFNPTVTALSAAQTGTNLLEFGEPQLSDYQSNYFTYSADSSALVTALSGNVGFTTKVTTTKSPAPFVSQGGSNGDISGIAFNVYPARLHARALQGDIDVKGPSGSAINLFPSTQGNLSFLAAKNISTDKGVTINVPDADPTLLASAFNPSQTIDDVPFLLADLVPIAGSRYKGTISHATIPLYLTNSELMRVVAQEGDVTNLRLITPTHTLVSAGRDIKEVTFEFQNVRESDVSTVKAGRDIVFSTPRKQIENTLQGVDIQQGIDITGFGRLDVMAGRDISLGASRGIQSIGAQRNPNLLKNGFGEESGADISLFAGVKAALDYSGFTNTYLTDFAAPTGMTSSKELVDYALNWNLSVRANAERFMKAVSAVTHRDYLSGAKLASVSDQELGAFVATARTDLQNLPAVNQQQIGFRLANTRGDQYAGDLIEFVTSSRFGGERLNAATLLALPLAEQHTKALAAFKAAPASAQRELLLQAYFNEVKQGGVQDVSGQITDKEKDGFARSFAAIEALFPGQAKPTTTTPTTTADTTASPYQGDLSLIFSTVQTQQGGDVNLLIPGGGINVGVAAVSGGAKKDSSKLGLIALRNGNINTTVGMDISVNSSRVFALDGGDILLWSSTGNIDAGRGAKTALSVPPPIINEDGSVNFQAAVAGSGIRNSRFTPNRVPGAVYLFAPVGKVDAGDAGIGSQGDVLIAAQQVIGADNIDVGGISIGIPVTTGVSAGVAAAGASATAATDNSADETSSGGLADALDNRSGAFVTVDILGFDF